MSCPGLIPGQLLFFRIQGTMLPKARTLLEQKPFWVTRELQTVFTAIPLCYAER